jgi:O-antigen/teichoic acid export membrane protein
MMSNGGLRLAISVLGVLALGWQAAGMMTGVLAGMAVALGVCVWLARPIWRLKPEPFAWGPFLAQVIPLMLAMAAFQFLFTADTMFAKGYFDGESMAGYVAAGTMARALMWLVGPLATVMFPKLVHSAARAEKSDLMGWVLGGTAALALAGAGGLSLLGPLFVRVIYKESFVEVAAALLPWYAFAMIPLTLSNVLLYNLLARSSFKVVPLLCLLAAGYGVALTQFHGSQVTILQTLGVFNTLMLAACGWFTWADKRKANL